MSASQRPGKNGPDATDDVPPDINSYPIEIPQAFLDAYEGDTVIEKLRNAEAAESTTGESERDACNRCGSVRVHRKTGFDSQHDVDRPYRCTDCGAHISELVPPAIGARDDAQLGLEVFADE